MDRADIPIEVALSIVLAAAVDGSDRQGLLTALSGGRPAVPAPRSGADDERAPALVFAFPARDHDPDRHPDHDPDGPAAA